MNYFKYQSIGVIRVVNLFGEICAFFFLDQIFNLEIFQSINKVIHPKYYKHLKKSCSAQPFGQIRMSQFLAEQLAFQGQCLEYLGYITLKQTKFLRLFKIKIASYVESAMMQNCVASVTNKDRKFGIRINLSIIIDVPTK